MPHKSKRVKATKPKCKTVSRRRISGGFWPFSFNNDTNTANGPPTATAAPTPENKSSSTGYFSGFSLFGTSAEKPPVVKGEQGSGVNVNKPMGGKKRSKKLHTSRKHRKTNKNAAK